MRRLLLLEVDSSCNHSSFSTKCHVFRGEHDFLLYLPENCLSENLPVNCGLRLMQHLLGLIKFKKSVIFRKLVITHPTGKNPTKLKIKSEAWVLFKLLWEYTLWELVY